MIHIGADEDGHRLILSYSPGRTSNPEWVIEEFDKGKDVTLVKTFTFGEHDLVNNPRDPEHMGEPNYEFMLGYEENGYYRIHAGALGIQDDVLISTSMNFRKEMFVAAAQIAIFPKISALVRSGEILIGGDKEDAMPEADFEALVSSFPNSTEQRKYVSATVSRLLKDHFDLKSDPEKSFDDFIRTRRKPKAKTYKSEVSKIELEKYTYIRDEISRLLSESETYHEREWQKLILKFIIVLFPKYIHAVEEVRIHDSYLDKPRTIDLLLIDVDGYVDLIEIKKPENNFLVSNIANSATRDNFIPRKGLSNTIMQAEKYLYHLAKSGKDGEKKITDNLQRKKLLDENLQIRIASPKAMIIAGRSNGLSDNQRFDFQIIKRHYSNMMEILSYDDILERLDRIIEKFRRQMSE